jgi:hypothetical protein
MQLLGAISLLLCVSSMVAIMFDYGITGACTFAAALLLMALSLVSLVLEIVLSGGALAILLNEVAKDRH